jgi:hypothetical protein
MKRLLKAPVRAFFRLFVRLVLSGSVSYFAHGGQTASRSSHF